MFKGSVCMRKWGDKLFHNNAFLIFSVCLFFVAFEGFFVFFINISLGRQHIYIFSYVPLFFFFPFLAKSIISRSKFYFIFFSFLLTVCFQCPSNAFNGYFILVRRWKNKKHKLKNWENILSNGITVFHCAKTQIIYYGR